MNSQLDAAELSDYNSEKYLNHSPKSSSRALILNDIHRGYTVRLV